MWPAVEPGQPSDAHLLLLKLVQGRLLGKYLEQGVLVLLVHYFCTDTVPARCQLVPLVVYI